MHLGQEVVEDYVAMRAHPLELLRPSLPGTLAHAKLGTMPLRRVSVCGLVVTRQRPGTASGGVFLMLEDETGVANIVVWTKGYEQFRRSVIGGRLLQVTGQRQREGIVVHLIAEQIDDLSDRRADLGHLRNEAIGITRPRADDAPAHHPREQPKRLFPSRDFH